MPLIKLTISSMNKGLSKTSKRRNFLKSSVTGLAALVSTPILANHSVLPITLKLPNFDDSEKYWELVKRPELDTVYVPIGLGSGICGLAAAREGLGLQTTIVGVVSAAAPAYALSFEARAPRSHPVTTRIADGMACRTPADGALEIIWRHVDRIVQVGDDEIEDAMRAIFTDTHNVAEGAGAAGLAALMRERDRMAGHAVGIVLTGGNVDRDVFARVLADHG